MVGTDRCNCICVLYYYMGFATQMLPARAAPGRAREREGSLVYIKPDWLC